jgi:hypothetical protein
VTIEGAPPVEEVPGKPVEDVPGKPVDGLNVPPFLRAAHMSVVIGFEPLIFTVTDFPFNSAARPDPPWNTFVAEQSVGPFA